jgi:glucose/arabinose dehydrogenase
MLVAVLILLPAPDSVSGAAEGQTAKGTEKESKAPPRAFECRWADGPITIDGKADEPAWKDAQVIDNFYLPWLGSKARPAKTATKAKLLWDREYLYFCAEMEDTDLYADVTEENGQTWDNDVFELFFKPADDKPGYYEFQVNAAGTKMNVFFPRRGAGGFQRFKKDGQFHIDAKVHLRGTLNKWTDKDEGWSVEGRIPWTDFMRTGGRPDIGEKWKFALCRYDYSVDFEGPELSTCAPLASRGFPDFHYYEDYATVTFTAPPEKSRQPYGIARREPLTTSTVVGSPDPPPPYRVERAYPQLKLNFPIAVRHIPGSDQFFIITEEHAYGDTVISRFKDDPTVSTMDKVLDLKGVAYDIAFHPQFEKNGYVFVGWNGAGEIDKAKKHTKVTRYTLQTQAPWKLDPASAKLILEWPSDGHNGGAICFGKDGMLYVTSGDGTSDSDTNVMGQRMDVLLSKLLRIDIDHPDEGKTYSVPKNNPFVGKKDIRPETWAYGFRNPWRIHCDARTGHIWVGNNGQDLWEQIFFVRKGDNFGWSVYEGSHPFYLERKLGPTPHVKPTFEHHHSEARSMTGGLVYYGDKQVDLAGAYLYGDYSTGRIWAGKHDGEKVVWHKEIAQTRLQITGFGTDAKGEVLICDHDGGGKGGLFRLAPTPKDLPKTNFPKKLSDSGLFASVKDHKMQPGMIPYSVNAPLWSDGAHKERWLGLPGADSKIDYTRTRGWGFPDKTVIVKSFALELEEGKPKTRRWVETRFLTKQGKEWFGYSYLWNDDQTDAVLVDAKGADKEFIIGTADGDLRSQKWHFPSRSECMVCHSRAAEWVLGLTELQMNKDHDYGGCVDNQLRVFEHLGLFNKFNYGRHANEILREEWGAKGLTEERIKQLLEKTTATRLQREPKDSALLAFGPDRYRKLVDPYDRKADLDKRARSYLHANCAQCHVEAGGGNALFNLEFTVKPEAMKVFDVRPVHNTFGLADARLIAPGHPERSVLLHRVSHREQGHMPPLATSMVDSRALEMLREWIKLMPAAARMDK